MSGMKSYSGLVGALGVALRRQSPGRRGGSAFRVWRGSVECACRSKRRKVSNAVSPLSIYDGGRETTHLSNPGPQIAPDEVFPPLEFRLNDYEAEVRFCVHVARHLLHLLNLLLDALVYALDEAVCGPSKHPSVFSVSHTTKLRTGTYSRSSGADLSATQARVKACKSRFPLGAVSNSGSASRRISSMSISS
jgi:hypothetical protein